MGAKTDGGRMFNIHVAAKTADEFRAYAEVAARLAPLGRVMVDISTLPTRRPFGIAPGVSPWHDYLTELATLPCFFPHPDLVPHLPKGYAEANRKHMLACAAVLEELGLESCVWTAEPSFWPESYFAEHPDHRGPRVDHPRRSTREEFSACVDTPAVLEMYSWMVAELKRAVPSLAQLGFRDNDVGSGMCWNSALYTGMRGPRHCQNIDPGVRVGKYCQALHDGAVAGGGAIRVKFNGNFYNNEVYTIMPHLPPETYLEGWKTDAKSVFGQGNSPVRGIIDPLALIGAVEGAMAPGINQISLSFNADYRRANDTVENASRAVDMVIDCVEKPTSGLRDRQERLYDWCGDWAGTGGAARLYDAMCDVNEAFRFKGAAYPRNDARQCGLTGRQITRPMVIKPELLTDDEESYFLPHIFNVRRADARTEYTELHGSRADINPLLRTAGARIGAAGAKLSGFGDAPAGEWLASLGRALRIRASFCRSACNFHQGQAIRDRYAEILAGPERTPPKVGSHLGDPGNQEWFDLQRDEFDNAAALLAEIEAGGDKLVMKTDDAALEDPFILGPDLAGALRKKMKIMRDHWRDVERWLAAPHM